MLRDLLGALVDLALPADCAGCGARGGTGALCADCVEALGAVTPQRVRPAPEPAGLPRTVALAAYDGALRAALLAYKEKGRHALAAPLGDALAAVVAHGLIGDGAAGYGGVGDGGVGDGGVGYGGVGYGGVGYGGVGYGGVARPGVLLAPVPATAASARRRYGDHVGRLAGRAARTLRRRGLPAAVVSPLRALPRVDSAELTAAERLAAAPAAFAVRPGRLPAVRAATAAGVALVLVDDIITTGATLAATAGLLRAAGVDVAMSAVLAATQRRQRDPIRRDLRGT